MCIRDSITAMRLKRREPSSARRKAVCQSSGTEAVYMPVTISIENLSLIHIYLAFGIHPEFAETYTEGDMAALGEFLKHPKCVALGEMCIRDSPYPLWPGRPSP